MAAPDLLRAHAERLQATHLRELFAADPRRFDRFSMQYDGLLLDYSKQRIDTACMASLRALWGECDVAGGIARMRAGEAINHSERRAVLHIALRHDEDTPIHVAGTDVMPAVRTVLADMAAFVEAVHAGRLRGATGQPFSDVVNIGIGGSDLGPKMATQALTAHHLPGIRTHFISNLDAVHLGATLARLDPASTLFIVASKTFTTQETLRNARSARSWLAAALGEAAVRHHFVAVSANTAEVQRFGIATEQTFPFWDWVGGRFSLWSAIGLPLALAIGFDRFRELLAGAAAMDRHFFTAPVERNLPGTLALLDYWNATLLGAESRAVLPYSQSLSLLPAYLQQLEMESNGKRVSGGGTPLEQGGAPIVWGEAGTNGQHAFFQLLHQGGRLVPCEFIACVKPDFALEAHHDMLLANCFAQAEALMWGKTLDEARAEMAAAGSSPAEVDALAPHKVCPGNQPSTTLLMTALTPHALGQLLALYEHKVFVLGLLWGINSFDQWGVEFGKQLARRLQPMIADGATPAGIDASTAGLVAAARRLRDA